MVPIIKTIGIITAIAPVSISVLVKFSPLTRGSGRRLQFDRYLLYLFLLERFYGISCNLMVMVCVKAQS